MQKTARYLKSLLLLTVLWMSANVVFNLVVDPFNAYQWVHRDGFNTVKARAAKFERIATPLILERVQARRLFMGTSRTETAFDGNSPALVNQPARTTLNLGMRGASIYETMMLFQHAIQTTPVREAIIGLEIHAFSVPGPGRSELDAYVARDWQGQSNRGFRLHQFRDSLFALDVTNNSLATLERQSDDDDIMTADGRYLSDKTLDEALKGGSVKHYFGRWVTEYVKGNWTPCHSGEVVFRYNDRFDSFARFRDILVLAAENQVALKLYISPAHVLIMDAMQQSGVWPFSEAWKTELLHTIDQVNSDFGSNFTIVDFEGVDQFSTEPVPENNHQRMTWFIDPVHMAPALGDAILARLFQPDNTAQWGVTLRQDQLTQQLQHLRQDMQRYRQENPQDVAFVQEIVNNNLPLRRGARTCQQTAG